MLIYLLLGSSLLVSVGTALLYQRSKRRDVLTMLVGLLLVWSAAGLALFGPTTTKQMFPNSAQTTQSDSIRHVVFSEEPLAITRPLFALGLIVFSCGFVHLGAKIRRHDSV